MAARTDIEADFPPLMLQQVDALRDYAGRHWRYWKEDLRDEWMGATAVPLLHHLRNTHGPYWLRRFKLPS
jgi:hypothetical protein